MHADDTNYTMIKNGVVAVSGTGPAIRVDGNRLVIRDGPQETPPLVLTRAEGSRKLRHIIVCGHAGGFVTFDALRWLRDTGVAFSQLDWDGAVVIASGPRGTDRPALRRAQVLVCSGAIPAAAVAITREIVRVKLKGQAEVARLMGSADASATIDSLAAAVAPETDGAKVLSIEARAASIYWKLWESVPVKFARRNPQRLGPRGQWRPGRPDPWLTFGTRASMLTGKPFRATTPGNALVNFLYAVLETEMTVALLAVGLDSGIGMFHADVDRRSSLALDAIEALRPYVDYWLFAYLGSSVFANRDFAELPDGEVRLTHPLNSHLTHTAALWRKACEPVAGWLAQSFGRAAGATLMADDRMIAAPQHLPAQFFKQRQLVAPLAPPLPALIAPARGHRPPSLRAGLREDPVPRMCCECGRALQSRQRKFCSAACFEAYHLTVAHAGFMEKGAAAREAMRSAGLSPGHGGKATISRSRRNREHQLAASEWARANPAAAGHSPRKRNAPLEMREWYLAQIQPRLAAIKPAALRKATGLSPSYILKLRLGQYVAHPRHWRALAVLAGVSLPPDEPAP